ncbi:RING-H2 finger protein ATL64-like [Cynara cardunculus var. scolymus]|uniref:Zinc finger, RING/FYVE/PHD-type n=1 Tax=Cynara cardunculus var. scolymus TaxID=59895 RepID=A0A103XT09_CYNCS|nr:RING-H2 finger protein ATL64-like [Cynara cardunculus var. scolymus]KVH96331.1 Zinc finger, RING/FYVE/PHD-type [Cynara cardunculus var. scolymus]
MAPNPLLNLSAFLNWVWDFLIHLSFFHHQTVFPVTENSLTDPPTGELVECAVCLSNIKEDEEKGVLRCKHLFHRKCLDRCLEHRHTTCPLCRDYLVAPRMVCELGRELIVFNFCDGNGGSGDDHFDQWWLR